LIVALVLLLFSAGGLTVAYFEAPAKRKNQTSTSTGRATKAESAVAEPVKEVKSPHDLAMEKVRIVKQNWYKEADIIMKVNLTIRNEGSVSVKDLTVVCADAAPSGTIIDSNKRTIYEVVPAHRSRSFRGFDMGFIHSQAERSRPMARSAR
jgi:hypothetical protein